jgi:hypothetical protein
MTRRVLLHPLMQNRMSSLKGKANRGKGIKKAETSKQE